MGKSLLVVLHVMVGLWEHFHSFSGFLFVVAAAMLKLKAYVQLVWDKAIYTGCPEQVLPLCPSPPQPGVLFHAFWGSSGFLF